MPFQVTARTILQLGAELISSDAIAFYELIKNAFDAGSPKVEVRVVSRLTATTCRHILNGCDEFERSSDEDESKWQLLVQFALANLNFDALEANDLKQSLERAKNPMELRTAIEEANFIQFSDTGEGMSLQDLQEIYLTIGTTSRREQRKKAQESPSTSTKGTQSRRPILGEKGLGRLSVMRLGDGLRVETSKAGETHFNVLEVDWSIFSNDSGALLNSIEITPFIGHKKPDKASSGTKIRIFNLHADWDHQKLEDVARDELSKFTDPFSRENRSFIILWFNNEPVIIPNMNKRLFEHAHAFVQAVYDLDTNGVPYLRGHIDYRFTKRQKSFEIEGAHLSSIAGVPLETLVSLGSFSLQFYWFNNLILRAIEGIGSMQEVRNLVKRWAGGLMVFRDGFRVYPYGGLDDDWLKIDPDALAAAGYKVNRRQIIGKVDISSIHNPALVDQTSREGLRDSPEKQALIILLRHILGTEFRGFLNKVEQDRLTNDPMDLEELEGRLGQRERQLDADLKLLVEKHPALKEEPGLIDPIKDTLTMSRRLIREAREVAQSYENRREVTVHLAGLGLMVDIVAHELHRSTRHALDTIQVVNKEVLPARTKSLLNTLALQLQTIQTRLKILDPLGPSGRQRKESFDIISLVRDILASHEPQFEQDGIRLRLLWEDSGPEWHVKAVRGMFVQILENLIHNSVYWLRQQKMLKQNFQPEIIVELDKASSCIRLTDNGPGIPKERCEEVFWPFVTTKPPGEGKGLGLYISREIARYHDVTLTLSETPVVHDNTLKTFLLDLSKLEKSQ